MYVCFWTIFLNNPSSSRSSSGHVVCSFDNPAWIFPLTILKKFAKKSKNNSFCLKTSEDIFPQNILVKRKISLWQLARNFSIKFQKVFTKIQKKYKNTWSSEEKILLKWSSEHVEISIEISAKINPAKVRKHAALSPKSKLNLNFSTKEFFSHFFPWLVMVQIWHPWRQFFAKCPRKFCTKCKNNHRSFFPKNPRICSSGHVECCFDNVGEISKPITCDLFAKSLN